jgi:hypothetical protein
VSPGFGVFNEDLDDLYDLDDVSVNINIDSEDNSVYNNINNNNEIDKNNEIDNNHIVNNTDIDIDSSDIDIDSSEVGTMSSYDRSSNSDVFHYDRVLANLNNAIRSDAPSYHTYPSENPPAYSGNGSDIIYGDVVTYTA